MNPVAELLTRARERISVPERWTRGATARNSAGESCMVRDTDAISWCALGALIAENGRIEGVEYRLLVRAMNGHMVSEYNDAYDLTHAEILQAFDRAIELALELPQEEPTNA